MSSRYELIKISLGCQEGVTRAVGGQVKKEDVSIASRFQNPDGELALFGVLPGWTFAHKIHRGLTFIGAKPAPNSLK